MLYSIHQLLLNYFYQFVDPLHLVSVKHGDCLVALNLQLEILCGDFQQLPVRPLEAFGQSVLLDVLLERVAAAIDEQLFVVSHEDGRKVIVKLRETLLYESYCAI